jgi:HAD superfamily hydrolase (TIGR01509 family)
LTSGRAGLVFDFDGTIVDTEDSVFRSWAELWADHGHELPLDVWQSILGTLDGFDPWAELEARLGRPLDESHRVARRARRDELLFALDLRPGVASWLDTADALEVPVGIASSSPTEWVDANLLRLGLLDRFGYLACADGDEIRGKPRPDTFELACRALDVDPSRSVAVEDSPNGVAAAVAAGLFVVAVPHPLTADLDLSAADIVTDSLADLDLPDILGRAAARA